MPARSLLVVLLLAAPAAAADPAFPPPAAAVRLTEDIPYAAADGQSLRLDLAVPAGPGPHPVVVCLHGGAWRLGSRKDLSRPIYGVPGPSLIETLAAKGFAAASVSYRLAPRSKFPAQIADARTAVRFLRANAGKLRLDPARVGAWGFSAGGHLALLLGLAADVPGWDGPLYPDQSSRVGGVVDFFGPADLSLYGETPAIEQLYLVPLLGGTLASNPAAFRAASPVSYATKNVPPVLIVHGTADIVVPIIHSERLYGKLVAAGAGAEFVRVKGKGHGWGGQAATDSTDAGVRFLTEALAGSK